MIKEAQRAKAEKYLNSRVNYDGKIITVREWLQELKNAGYTPVVENYRDNPKEDKERERLNRIYRSSDFVSGNPNWPTTKKYYEDKAELEKGIFKTVYIMRAESSSYVITKTAYDYLMGENS